MMRRSWSEQERRWLWVAAFSLALILLLLLVVIPYVRALGQVQHRQERAAQLLTEIEQVRGEVAELRVKLRRNAAGSPEVSSTSLVESTASQLGLRDRLVSLRPQATGDEGELAEALEVAFEKVSLEELVRWLYAMEDASGGQQLSQLRMRKRFDNPEVFDVTLQVVRYRVEAN